MFDKIAHCNKRYFTGLALSAQNDSDHNYSAPNKPWIFMAFIRGCSLHEQAFR